MRILLTNDDGIDAPGIRAMRDALARLGEVVVVAPATQQSATGNAITLHKPLVVRAHDERSFSVEGTPADAVKLAFASILRRPPDLVVSGMNFGLNCGCNILYSGTLAGALEGAQHGVPGYAVSMEVSDAPRWKPSASAAARLIESLQQNGYRQPGIVFNINVPARRIRGVVVTRQEMTPYQDTFHRRQDPRGRVYYWYSRERNWRVPKGNGSVPSDQHSVKNGFITLTPLHRDLTHYELMDHLSQKRPWRAKNGRR